MRSCRYRTMTDRKNVRRQEERTYRNTKPDAGNPVFTLCIILLAFLFIIIRDPIFLTAPRLWAEEGSIYIQSVIDNGNLASLTEPHLGYFSLFANSAANYSVAILDLKYAAYGTTYLSLIFMLFCITAPLYLRSAYWSTDFSKAAIVFLSLLISSGEIWLNTINIHFYLGLFACYFLLSDHERLTILCRYFCYALLSLGALTCVTSVLLFPLYLIRQMKRHNISWTSFELYRSFPLVILIIGLIAQILFFSFGENEILGRLSISNISNFPEGFVRTSLYLTQFDSFWVSIFSVIAIFCIIAYSFCYHKIKHNEILVLFIYSSFMYAALSLDMAGGGRYGYIPSMILSIYLLNVLSNFSDSYRYPIYLLCMVFVGYKLQMYFDTSLYYQADWDSFSVEYTNTLIQGDDFVRVFPHWEGTAWGIVLR